MHLIDMVGAIGSNVERDSLLTTDPMPLHVMNMNPWELKTPDGSTIVINVRSVKRFPRSLAVHTVSRVLNNCGIATTIESGRGVAVGSGGGIY